MASSPHIITLVALLWLFSVCHGAFLSKKVGQAIIIYDGALSCDACGYPFNTIGSWTSVVTGAIWNNGAVCGACYSLKSKFNRVRVRVGGLCLSGAYRDCPGETTFFLTQKAYDTLAPGQMYSVPVTYQRVSCGSGSPIKFVVSRNGPAFISILVDNVAWYGTLSKLEVKSYGSSKWRKTTRAWGANWVYPGLLTYPLALRLTSSGNGKVLTTKSKCIYDKSDVTTFTCNVQF